MENNSYDKNEKKEEKYTELTEEEKYRYNRQTLLTEYGEKGQIKLKNSKVMIIGAGGLGSSCIMHLAGSGVGKMCIIDNDVVDVQNLHRQVIHNINNVGMNKALSAKKFVNLLNPLVEVIALNESFTNKNAIILKSDVITKI